MKDRSGFIFGLTIISLVCFSTVFGVQFQAFNLGKGDFPIIEAILVALFSGIVFYTGTTS